MRAANGVWVLHGLPYVCAAAAISSHADDRHNVDFKFNRKICGNNNLESKHAWESTIR